MGAAPLSWLAKIGGDTLKTKAKLLSSAINELHDNGQCKIVAVVDNTADNGKTVLITTDDNKTYSGTIVNKKCEFLLPPKTLYTVQKVSSGSAEFTTKVEAGYGDYILVHLNTGHVEVKQGDIVGLDYIKAATADNLKDKVPEANAVKELNSSLSGVSSSLTANNNQFYFDYKDGKYGFNTDHNRGADTFIPFSDGSFKISFVINAKTGGAVSSSIDQDSKWSNYNLSSTVVLSFDGNKFKMTGNSKSTTFGVYGGAEYVTVSCTNPKIIV